MATLNCDSDPDAKPVCNTNVVFIDTNLDTHLAVIVSEVDTVSDLKKRILSEHPLCFPKIGQIQIQAIKVKRKGYFYHLSDSMFVRSAFNGFNKSWFLSVDASALGEHGQNEPLFSPGFPNQAACLGIANNALIGSVDNALSFPSKRVSSFNNFQMLQLENKQDEKEEIPFVSPFVSEHTVKEAVKNLETGVKSSGNNHTGIPLPGSIPETQEDHCCVNHEHPSSHIEREVDGSSKGIKDDCNVCEDGTLKSVPSVKKKRKRKRKKEDAVQDDTSKENIASVDNALSFPSKRVSSFNNCQVPQLENKQDEKEENPFVGPCVSEHTKKEAVKNLETDVKSSGNNNPGIALPASIPETQDNCCINHEHPSSHVECEVDESSKGIKDDCNVCEEGTAKSVPSTKKKRKSKRKKEDTVQDDTSKENNASVVGSGKDTVHPDIVVPGNPSENADKEVKETEVLKEHQRTECNNNNAKNDIDAECSESTKEASEPGPAAKKKHRKRKRSLTHDSEQEMLKIETTSQKDEAQKSGEACKERKELKDQFEFNNDKSRDEVEFKHNKVTEEASDTRAPAKKKKKGKEKSGDESLFKEKSSMISDSNVDNASHHFLEDQHKSKYSSADQSTEHFNDTDPLRTSVLGGRRKGKKNSSNPHQTPEVTSSRKDDEADCSRIQGEGVQEEISGDGPFSKDTSMRKTTLDNMEIRTDACKEGIQSKVKRTGNPKNHCAIDMKVHPSDVNEPKELTEDNENIVLDHCHKSEAGQTEGAEEGREISPQNDPKPMLSEKCTPSNQDNTDANVRELNVASKVIDANGITETVKSEKKRRGIGKAKDSSGGPALREGIGLVDASESETIIGKSLKATNCDPISGNTESEENTLNQTEGKNVRQEEMKGNFLSATDKEDDFSADNAGSLEQIKTKANAEYVDEHVDKRKRKKSNNKQTSTAKSVSNMVTKDQVLDSKKPSPSSDSGTHANPSFKITKKNKSASTKSTNKSSRTNLEPVKYSIGFEPSDSRFNSGSNGSSQFPSNAPIGNHKLGPFEANDTTKDSKRSSGEKDDNTLEAPSKSNKINTDQQYASQQQQHEANLLDGMFVDKMNGADRTDIELMTGKSMHSLEATKEQIHAESLSSPQRLLSKEDGDVLRIHPDKKVPIVPTTGQNAQLSSWSNSAMSSIRENRKPHVNASGKSMDLEKRREHFPTNSKLSGNSIGGAVSNTRQKKSLLAGAIFKDDTSSTSEDEVDNSDASTRTPSDNSLLSDYSDGDSNAGLDSQQNGSHGGKRLENGGRSALKACLSGTKGMSIDHILRSSSRYKKAKITASQLEESESQPVDFVPDSLADM